MPRDSAPSEARKQGSGGGSPRKYDDLLKGPTKEGSNEKANYSRNKFRFYGDHMSLIVLRGIRHQPFGHCVLEGARYKHANSDDD
jgi:hypothetical protein